MAFLFLFGNDNENKKSERATLLSMMQTIFDQNFSPVEWKMKALRKLSEISEIQKIAINIENFKILSRNITKFPQKVDGPLNLIFRIKEQVLVGNLFPSVWRNSLQYHN